MKRTLPLSLAALLLCSGVGGRAATLYVDVNSANPVPPYAAWSTAATNIQDAVDAASAGDTVLVTNGLYQTGSASIDGVQTNRVAVGKSLTLQSINGAAATIIDGRSQLRCVYLTNTCVLEGFTLRNGLAQDGAGVWCASYDDVVTGCEIVTNTTAGGGGGAYGGSFQNCTFARNSATAGGGVYGANSLENCIMADNSATVGGGAYGVNSFQNCALTYNTAPAAGGAFGGAMNNCTIIGNTSGAQYATLVNCIVYYNGNDIASSSCDHCCITLDPGGTGNITNAPQMTDSMHIAADSHCRGAGGGLATGLDIDGEPWAIPPAIGCDEYYAGSITGPLSVSITTPHTIVNLGFALTFFSRIEGRASVNV